jgi:ribose/xylose/arabinose/galactoside ABC-type transport system permease subunit
MQMTNLMQHRLFLPLLALAMILLANLVLSPEFFHLQVKDGRVYGSLVDVLNRSAPCALLAIGMSLVIATGGIDLSVGAIVAITGAVCANLLNTSFDTLPLVILAALAIGLAAGMVNGSLVSIFGIQPIVATLVLMVAGRGIAQLINSGQIVTFQNDTFAAIGIGSLLGLPAPVVIALVVFLLVQFAMRFTALGLFIEACGCNPRASHYLGLNVRVIKFLVYCVSGLCAAIAGMVITADIQGADANNAGLWLELDAILAVVLGGAALSGGRFSLPLTMIGVLIIQAMSTTIIMSGIEPKYNLIIKSLVILVVLLLQSPTLREQLRSLTGAGKSLGGKA